MLHRCICFYLLLCFGVTQFIPPAHAQTTRDLGLPAPGALISVSPAFTPVLIKGVRINADDPFRFDFIIDTGKSGVDINAVSFKAESQKLVKYFLASLAIKEKDMWVNLSPYERDRMVPTDLGRTELGADMLAQDYLLKQLTASMIYPEKELGKKFWDKVFAQVRQQYGEAGPHNVSAMSALSVNTFNKVWVVADKAKVLERGQTAFVVGAHLKVMLEEDYLAVEQNHRQSGDIFNGNNKKCSHVDCQAIQPTQATTNRVSPRNTASMPNDTGNILRSIIVPAIEQEINEGQHFAQLRQMFYAMILASWYKLALKDALLNKVYSNKAKTGGLHSDDPGVNAKIYAQYLEAYKKGVFNYIKDTDAADIVHEVGGPNKIPRKYFSGGLNIMPDPAHLIERVRTVPNLDAAMATGGSLTIEHVRMDMVDERAPQPNVGQSEQEALEQEASIARLQKGFFIPVALLDKLIKKVDKNSNPVHVSFNNGLDLYIPVRNGVIDGQASMQVQRGKVIPFAVDDTVNIVSNFDRALEQIIHVWNIYMMIRELIKIDYVLLPRMKQEGRSQIILAWRNQPTPLDKVSFYVVNDPTKKRYDIFAKASSFEKGHGSVKAFSIDYSSPYHDLSSLLWKWVEDHTVASVQEARDRFEDKSTGAFLFMKPYGKKRDRAMVSHDEAFDDSLPEEIFTQQLMDVFNRWRDGENVEIDDADINILKQTLAQVKDDRDAVLMWQFAMMSLDEVNVDGDAVHKDDLLEFIRQLPGMGPWFAEKIRHVMAYDVAWPRQEINSIMIQVAWMALTALPQKEEIGYDVTPMIIETGKAPEPLDIVFNVSRIRIPDFSNRLRGIDSNTGLTKKNDPAMHAVNAASVQGDKAMQVIKQAAPSDKWKTLPPGMTTVPGIIEAVVNTPRGYQAHVKRGDDGIYYVQPGNLPLFMQLKENFDSPESPAFNFLWRVVPTLNSNRFTLSVQGRSIPMSVFVNNHRINANNGSYSVEDLRVGDDIQVIFLKGRSIAMHFDGSRLYLDKQIGVMPGENLVFDIGDNKFSVSGRLKGSIAIMREQGSGVGVQYLKGGDVPARGTVYLSAMLSGKDSSNAAMTARTAQAATGGAGRLNMSDTIILALNNWADAKEKPIREDNIAKLRQDLNISGTDQEIIIQWQQAVHALAMAADKFNDVDQVYNFLQQLPYVGPWLRAKAEKIHAVGLSMGEKGTPFYVLNQLGNFLSTVAMFPMITVDYDIVSRWNGKKIEMQFPVASTQIPNLKYLLRGDAAMTPGGIDLNAGKMTLDVSKEGGGVRMNADAAVIARFKRGVFSGIIPVIERIERVVDIRPLLGLTAK